MEKVELEVEMDIGLVDEAYNLAQRYFGDESEASLERVLELAFRMRQLWSRSVERGQLETDEVVSKWEFPESTAKQENNSSIQDWLFRR
jgi:hypothetical protein